MAADIMAQLPQLEAMASVLYNSQVGGCWVVLHPAGGACRPPAQCAPLQQLCVAICHTAICQCFAHGISLSTTSSEHALKQVPQERAQAEQMLRVFATSTEYVPHCKVRQATKHRLGWWALDGGAWGQ